MNLADDVQKTVFGGVLTYIIILFICWVLVQKGIILAQRKKPYLKSVKETIPFTDPLIDQKFQFTKMNRNFYRLVDHNFRYYKLGEVEKYLKFDPVNQIETINKADEKRKKIRKHYKLRDCTLGDFKQTEFEEGFARFNI